MSQTTLTVRPTQVAARSRGDPRPVPGEARRPNGLVLYHGPSLLNGQPVVCIATGLVRTSRNRKTGPFVQTYILPDVRDGPLAALRSGSDDAVCGDCPHRPLALPDGRRVLGSCYVNVGQAPLAIWWAYRRGAYLPLRPRQHLALFRGRLVRLGSYGDPAAVPLDLWDQICAVAAGWTGYTHQFRTCASGYARYCMASCETVADRQVALRLGYRTFRVRLPEQPLDDGEFICPASDEGGGRLTCADCRACSGTSNRQHASPCIVVHESPSVPYKVRTYRAFLASLTPDRNGRTSLL